MKDTVENILKVEGVKARGYGIIPKIAMKDDRLTIEAKAIYSYFCSYAGSGTTAFPRIKMIIKDLGISKDRYYKHFNLLKKYGYIKTEQKNIDGKFEQNIYILVEKPEEISENNSGNQKPDEVDKEPFPCFKDTENKESVPFPCFPYTEIPYTENKDTNNINSIYNINNLLKLSVSLSDNNNIYNNNLYNNKLSKSSVSQSEDGQTEIDTRTNDNLLKSIFEASQVDLYFGKEKEFIIKIISKLYHSKKIKLNDKVLNQKEIRYELSKLNLSVIDYALRKFKSTKESTSIKKPEKYFMSILLNSIRDVQAENIRIS